MSNSSTCAKEPKLPPLIQRVAIGPKLQKEVTREEVAEAMISALSGHEDMMQLGIFLIALRMRGERMHEYAGVLDGILTTSCRETVAVDQLVELAEPFDGSIRQSNYSAFLPAVLAACGLPTFVSGVYDCGPKHGVTAAKVYAHLGKSELPNIGEAAGLLESPGVGWAYCGQQYTAPALYAIRGQRDLMVKRTALTTLERLVRPFEAVGGNTHLHIGYVHKAYPPIYTQMAAQAGYDSVCVVKGMEGGIFPAPDKPVKAQLVKIDQSGKSENVGLDIDSGEDAPSSLSLKFDVGESCEAQVVKASEQGLAALAGAHGSTRELLAMTGALILCSTGLVSRSAEGRDQVRKVLDSGTAQERFDAFLS